MIEEIKEYCDTEYLFFADARRPVEQLSHFYIIEGNLRPGKEHIPIEIPIANVSDQQLTEKNLLEIFRRANGVTINIKFPCEDDSSEIDGKMVHRPNHNGTHSARQARLLQVLFRLIGPKGLTEDEKLHLLLGAYFLRAGRVDESSYRNPPADDYYTRSAMIYEEYAKQLGGHSETIAWVKKLIINSCKPYGVREGEIDAVPKNLLGYHLLTMVHELDLIRCFYEEEMAETVESMKGRLDYFSIDGQYVELLIEFAKTLCEVTGCGRDYDGFKGDPALFAQASTEGGFCWEQVSQQRPLWRL